MRPWLVDTDVFIEGERGNPAFTKWLDRAGLIATADIVRGEFLLGVHAVPDAALRQRGTQFYADTIAHLSSFPSDPADYAKAATLARWLCAPGQKSPRETSLISKPWAAPAKIPCCRPDVNHASDSEGFSGSAAEHVFPSTVWLSVAGWLRI